MKTGVHFGIDTSNYTTSAAAVTVAGEVYYAKRPLQVALGDRGLRQSDALFCHTRDLREVIDEVLSQVRNHHGDFNLLSVGVSDRPRRVPGSYMPCFLAGVNAAAAAASLSQVPLFLFSHQEGHLEAARYGAALENNAIGSPRFLAFHLSGGTTELLLAEEDGAHYRVRLLAQALDLTCGQFLDRCGVKLGLSFPAGAELEKLALSGEYKKKIHIPIKEDGINLSGFENQFDRLLSEGESRENLARFAFSVVIRAVSSLLDHFGQEDLPVLFSGGVASSVLLHQAFNGERCHFSPPQFCSDNAIGTALLARKEVLYGSHPGSHRHRTE